MDNFSTFCYPFLKNLKTSPTPIREALEGSFPMSSTTIQDTLCCQEIIVKGYEKVYHFTDPASGLNAFIAIHDTSLGTALGGTRIYPYGSEKEALEDVLRLARGMTHKSAVAEVGFGGGKSVIIADPRLDKTPSLLRAFGRAVESLKGQYICAEDSGCTTEDLAHIVQETRYVVGLDHAQSSGNPSPFTAWGVFRGIQSVAKRLYGSSNLEGKRIAIQGLGSVGSSLAEKLFWEGAKLIVADVDKAKIHLLAKRYDAEIVSPDHILKAECEIFAPCALGAILNDETIPQLRCRAIAGAANNQLHRDRHADALRDRGILYAPDFVINSGGLLNVAAEVEPGGYNPSFPRYKIHHIYDVLLAIYDIAERNGESTHQAALALAEYRIRYSIGKRTAPLVFHHSHILQAL
jgi:leucine dehydrogenase